MGMPNSENEKRRTERFDYPSRIEYALDADGEFIAAGKAVTINISNNGLSAYIFLPLVRGQEITIKTALPVDHRTATIQWIKRENGEMYKAGVRFKGEASAREESGSR